MSASDFYSPNKHISGICFLNQLLTVLMKASPFPRIVISLEPESEMSIKT